MKLVLIAYLFTLALPSGHGLSINVKKDGNNSQSCLNGTTSCQTIGYAVQALVNNNVTINVYYSHVFDKIPPRIYNQHDISLIGHAAENNSQPILNCSDDQNMHIGFYFNHSINVTVRSLSFVNCGTWHPTTANSNWTHTAHSDNLVQPSAISALFFFNCTNVMINHTHFTSNKGSGISLYNVVGVVNIVHSVFANHTNEGRICDDDTSNNTHCSPQATGVYIEMMSCLNFTTVDCIVNTTMMLHANYNIIHCQFLNNSNNGAYRNITDIPTPMELSDMHHWPFGQGGGLNIVLRVFKLKHFDSVISNNVFKGNKAVYGGGMALILRSGYPDHNYFVMESNEFVNNVADYDGGGLHIDINVMYNTLVNDITLNGSFRNFVYIKDTEFISNRAYWGGGLSFVAHPLNVTYVVFQVVSSVFSSNTYSGGGGAVALLRKEKPERNYFFIAKAQFYNCTFEFTHPVLPLATSQQYLSSTIHSEGIEILFLNVTRFRHNCASALRLSDTGATLYDDVTFENNTGLNGGGLSLSGKSWITLTDYLTIVFRNNRAYQYGGAIYYNPTPVMNMNMTSACFVWYELWDNKNVPVEHWRASVYFIDNFASEAGDAAYIADPVQCTWPNQLSLFDPNSTEIFNYSQQSPNRLVVSTPASQLNFEPNSNQYRQPVNKSEYANYTLMPGEQLLISLITKDRLNQHLPSSVVTVSCLLRNNYEQYNHQDDACYDSNSAYNIDEYNRQVLSDRPLLNFRLYGPSPSINNTTSLITNTTDNDNQLILLFKTDDPIPLVLPLLITFKSCDTGYQYNTDKHLCECVQNKDVDLSPVLCASNQTSAIEIPCVRHGYWYGELYNETVAFHYCRSNCHYYHIDKCDDYSGYVKFMKDKSVCRNGLSGPLCKQCANKDHHLSYNSYQCVPCTSVRELALVLLILLECLFIVFVILMFLKLNLRVTTAGFYGFLYFYSVLHLLIWLPLPSGLEAIIDVIEGVSSLDFELLKYSGTCFKDFRAIHYAVLHYVYPMAIMGLIFIIIKVDKSGIRRSQFFSGEAAIQALCIMLLITYTSISETSLGILMPVYYQSPETSSRYIQEPYVYVDPSIKYMDKRHHLPFWLIAMFMELFLVLPFSMLMFFAPWIGRWVNLSKIKPILDEYQSCFHDNYRWFAGVYLMARQVLYLITAMCPFPELAVYLQQMFCLSLLLLTATVQPYRSRILNIIDVLILSLLTFLSFTSSSSNGRQLFLNYPNLQYAVIGIVSILPFVIMILVVVVLRVGKLCHKQYILRKKTTLMQNPTLAGESESFSDRTSYTSAGDNEDLPPRFYEEEHTHRHDELTPLIKTTGHIPVGRGMWSRQRPNYSINNKPVTN